MRCGSTRDAAGRVLAAVLVLLSAALPAGPARAAEPTEAELEVARDRFKEGVALEDAGDYRAARAKFEQVAEVKTSPQVLYHLALCDENLGHLVAAEARYEKAIADAEAAGSVAASVADTARTRLEALRPRIPRLRIAIAGELREGDVVAVDGEERGDWQEQAKIDPGRHVVTVERDGATVAEAVVQVTEGTKASARLTLDADVPRAPPTPPPPATEVDEGGGGPPVAALIVGGAGIVALAVSGVTFGMSRVAIEDVRATCADPEAGTGCDPRSQAREDDARTLTVTSAVLLGVGAACVATGAVLWVTLDDEPAAGAGKPPQARRGVELAPLPYGLAARGRF